MTQDELWLQEFNELRLSLRGTTAIPPAETRRSGEILQLDQAQQETTECGRIETGKGESV